MAKFKPGDRVRKIDGTPFSNGELVVTVSHYKYSAGPWFVETNSWLDDHFLELAAPCKPKGISGFIRKWEQEYAQTT